MKKLRMVGTFLLTFMMMIMGVSAACDASELNRVSSEAFKVSVTYEEVEELLEAGTYTPPDGIPEDEIDNYTTYVKYFKVYITNITEDIYVVVKDTYSNEEKTYTYQDSDNGTITIENRHIDEINEYTIKVYATNQECSRTALRTIKEKTPRYNEYYSMGICDGLEDYYLCNEYVSFDIDYSFEEVADKIDSYVKGKIKEEEEKKEQNKNFFEKNRSVIIATSVVIIVAGVATTVVIIVRRRRVV